MFNLLVPRDNNNTISVENMQLLIPLNRINVSDGNLKVRGAKYYNMLPYETKAKPSFDSFKEAVKVDKGISVKK